MRHTRSGPRTFDLTIPCPLCGFKIVPHELIRTDGEHILCPQCGREFVDTAKAKTPS